MADLTISVLAKVIGSIPGALIKRWFTQRTQIKATYSVVWKKSDQLEPREVMGLRGDIKGGFREYFWDRPECEEIRRLIDAGQNVLVIGSPLAGKTRTVYQALKRLNEKRDVIMPHLREIKLDSFCIPNRISWKPGILLLDDMQKFAALQNFQHLLREFTWEKHIIVATCRSGDELRKLKSILHDDYDTLFRNKVEIGKVSKEVAEEVSERVSMEAPDSFDGNIGSIFRPLTSMKERFNDCSSDQQKVLISIKRLFMAGVYEDREVFSFDRIAKVCREIEGIDLKESESRCQELLRQLQDQGFIRYNKGKIETEEVYLEQAVITGFTLLQNFTELVDVFSHDPAALFALGNRAKDTISTVTIRGDYVLINRLAIAAYSGALAVYTLDAFPEDYAMTQNNLGNAYSILAEVENKAVNSRKAIEAFEQALEIYTLDAFPENYAASQNNLGVAYTILAEAESKAENSRMAIKAYDQALIVRTLDAFPTDYAGAKSNLGNAYRTLATVENKAENCRKAIDAYEQALIVRTLDAFPKEYAVTQINLGVACRILVEVENTAENGRKAIEAFEQALEIYTPDAFPKDYAGIQINLGAVYQALAAVENYAENTRKAIEAHRQALEIFSLAAFPMQYASSQAYLGIAHQILAKTENKAGNCRNAIEACKQALEIYTRDAFPENYAKTQSDLGAAYQTLAAVENKGANNLKAIEAFEQALEIYTLDAFPENYAKTQNNLGVAYLILADVENKGANCRKAIDALEMVLVVWTLDDLPLYYAMAQNNLGNAFFTLAEEEDERKNSMKAREAFRAALRVYQERSLLQGAENVARNLRLLDEFCSENLGDDKSP